MTAPNAPISTRAAPIRRISFSALVNARNAASTTPAAHAPGGGRARATRGHGFRQSALRPAQRRLKARGQPVLKDRAEPRHPHGQPADAEGVADPRGHPAALADDTTPRAMLAIAGLASPTPRRSAEAGEQRGPLRARCQSAHQRQPQRGQTETPAEQQRPAPRPARPRVSRGTMNVSTVAGSSRRPPSSGEYPSASCR